MRSSTGLQRSIAGLLAAVELTVAEREYAIRSHRGEASEPMTKADRSDNRTIAPMWPMVRSRLRQRWKRASGFGCVIGVAAFGKTLLGEYTPMPWPSGRSPQQMTWVAVVLGLAAFVGALVWPDDHQDDV